MLAFNFIPFSILHGVSQCFVKWWNAYNRQYQKNLQACINVIDDSPIEAIVEVVISFDDDDNSSVQGDDPPTKTIVPFPSARFGLADEFPGKPTRWGNYQVLDNVSAPYDPFKKSNGVIFTSRYALPSEQYAKATKALSEHPKALPLDEPLVCKKGKVAASVDDRDDDDDDIIPETKKKATKEKSSRSKPPPAPKNKSPKEASKRKKQGSASEEVIPRRVKQKSTFEAPSKTKDSSPSKSATHSTSSKTSQAPASQEQHSSLPLQCRSSHVLVQMLSLLALCQNKIWKQMFPMLGSNKRLQAIWSLRAPSKLMKQLLLPWGLHLSKSRSQMLTSPSQLALRLLSRKKFLKVIKNVRRLIFMLKLTMRTRSLLSFLLTNHPALIQEGQGPGSSNLEAGLDPMDMDEDIDIEALLAATVPNSLPVFPQPAPVSTNVTPEKAVECSNPWLSLLTGGSQKGSSKSAQSSMAQGDEAIDSRGVALMRTLRTLFSSDFDDLFSNQSLQARLSETIGELSLMKNNLPKESRSVFKSMEDFSQDISPKLEDLRTVIPTYEAANTKKTELIQEFKGLEASKLKAINYITSGTTAKDSHMAYLDLLEKEVNRVKDLSAKFDKVIGRQQKVVSQIDDKTSESGQEAQSVVDTLSTLEPKYKEVVADKEEFAAEWESISLMPMSSKLV